MINFIVTYSVTKPTHSARGVNPSKLRAKAHGFKEKT